jgi:hypothetical protein
MTSRAALRRASAEVDSAGISAHAVMLFAVDNIDFNVPVARPCRDAPHVFMAWRECPSTWSVLDAGSMTAQSGHEVLECL